MPDKKLYELTNPQKTIWYTEQFYKGSVVNNLGGYFLIDTEVNFNLLKKAIYQFVEDNDAFNIKLCYDENGEIKQYFSNFEEFDIPLINLKNENDLNSLTESCVEKPFSLIDEKLFSFKMFDFPDNKGGFVFVAHHIIFDAYTASLTASKIINNYSDLLKGEEFTQKPTSYLDYIESENNYIISEKYNKDKEYWNKIYETVPEIASIPSMKQESENSNRANRKTFVISKDYNEKINKFCSNNKISAFNFFMGLYAIYIGRVSNLDDFVIGTPILNRSNFQEKNTPGMFISTLALRIALNNDLSFVDFAKKIAADSFAMFRHQKYSYQNILDDIRKQTPDQPNLYDILISYQNARTNRNSSEIPYRVEWFFNNAVADKMQIHLFDLNDEGCLNISYDYRTNRYDEKDIDFIHSRILHMVNQVLDSDNISLNDIEIVTPDEKNVILNKFNNTNKNYTIPNSIIEMIEETAINTPNITAIEAHNSFITYKELLVRINKLSNYLLSKNIEQNSNIGIFTTRKIDTIIGILACLKINCTYVPIDVEYPIDRITYMIKTSNIKCILSENENDFSIISNIKDIEKININYEKYKNENEALSENFKYDCNSNLYIIFTSGSTGKPKGVTISHKNMINLMLFEKNETNILEGSHNKILQFATMSFDVSYQEIFSALLFGNTLVLIDEESRKDMNKLSNYILNKAVNTLFIPPAYLKLLVETDEIRDKLKTCIKNIITAGEALVITKGIRDLIESGITVHNHYGPAETHVATAYTITQNNITTHPPIGKPISNSYIHILDKNNMLSPIGIVGEIIISGDCVGNGYFDNKELSAHRFKVNPYNNKRMYYTGDLGFFDYEGNIHFVGRSDFQVKLNGFRVELDEIDQVLLKNENIKGSISVIHEENNKKYIITYYTESTVTDEYSLFKHLGNSLPFYMIPKKLVKMDNLPINNNGKIDRKRLPKIILSDIDETFVEPQTETEIRLAKIWKTLFNIDKVSTNYNFFNIGGDSLLAIKLSAIIQSKFGVEISVSEIYADPTLSKLAELINSKNRISENEIKPCKEKDNYALSSAQKRIYYASKVSGDESCLYNMPGVIIFDKMPDIEKLNTIFNKIIKRHSSLRTSFNIVNNEVCQIISNNVSFKIDSIKTEKTDINEIVKDFVKPFDLRKAPLLRAQIAVLKDKVLLLFDMHHIISDGLSLTILTKELCALYNDEELKPLNLSYVDYSEWENNNIKNNTLEKSKQYWVNQFKNEIPVLNMPNDYVRPAIKTFEGAKIHKVVSKELTEKINNLSKKLNASNYMILLACYYIILSKYSSQEDIVVGSPVVGRNKNELLNLIGMFVNSMPLKNHINSSDSFIEFLNTLKFNIIESLEHQDYPFDELVNSLNLTRDTSRNPLFDTLFVYQNDGFAPVNFKGLKSEIFIPDIKISKFDLSLEIVPSKEILELNFEYAISLFNKDTIENFANHYINILKQITNNQNIKICDIDLLSEDEKNRILFDFNNTNVKYDETKTIATLFEEQVNKTPDNIALVFGDNSLTYKGLNEKANSLAYYLKNEIGIKNNDIVGVMTSRSLEVIISILAVVKTGGAYIPIDPTFPKERVSYMLDNSNSKVLLTQNKLLDKINFNNKVCIDLENESIYSLPNNNLENSNIPSDLMYVIYTSGSTGNPKGVMVTHRVFSNFTNYCNNYIKYLKNPSNDAIVSITTISFDIFAYETLISLQRGLKVVLANENEQTTPHLLNKLMEKNNVKIIQSTPSIMQIFVNNINEMPALKKINYAILAGEQLPLDLVKKLHSLSNAVVYNGYGPSETYYCTLAEMNDKIITIGKPIYNSQMYILDKNLKPVPVGVIGDIYISGDCVGKGYLNNKELTNKSFIPNPFLEGVTMYRSGDLGKYLEDGNILCLGRSDHQIKIRGLRIELEEIESVLLKYPNIIKVAVTKQTLQNREFISAYYVSDKRISVTELRKYLSSYLPKYMVPSYYTALDDLPYTPNGKVDKKLLPLPSDIIDSNKDDYEAPKTDIQKQIVSLFENVLNTKPIGINDNFFELGGDSLLAMNLNMELSKITDKITYQDIFHNPTVSDLEKIIKSDKKDELFKKVEDIPEGVMYVLNKSKKLERIKKSHSKNILLTGATGFLGVHILEELLRIDNTNIYCIIRSEPGLTSENKLIQKLDFYFDGNYKDLINKRIFILTGDTNEPNFGLNQDDLIKVIDNTDIVINSAANVSHYGKYENFYKSNVLSVKHMIAFCRNFNKKFYHISTTGVAGISLDSSYLSYKKNNKIIFDESNLYIGQNPETVYSYSKFEAEIQVLTAINNGLDGYILRMGNLMPRYRDGKFQENVLSNAFINRVASFLRIGIIPKYLIDFPLEFTPVDYAAKAICEIAFHYTNKNRIFHIFNNKYVPFSRCLNLLKKQNLHLEVLDEKDFVKRINEIFQNEDYKYLLKYILDDFDENNHIDYRTNMEIKSKFTKRYLRRTLFFWPKISQKYLERFFEIIKEVL